MKKSLLFFVLIVAVLLFTVAVSATGAGVTQTAAEKEGFVTDGLVSYYSGSGNNGKTIWEDLEGDNDITGLTVNDTNYFKDSGFVVNNTQQVLPAELIDVIGGTNEFTVEIRLSDFEHTSGVADILGFNNQAFYLFFGNGATTLTLKTFPQSYTGDWGYRVDVENMSSELQDASLLTVTFKVGENKSDIIVYHNGVLVGSVATRAEYAEPLQSATTLSFGKNFSAVYESMRFYNRALTAEEVQQNFEAECIAFDGAVSTDGFAIRFTDYNGLRGIFSFDKSKDAKFALQGYELIEYGAIAVPEAKYNGITINTTTYELESNGKKIAVWSNGEFVGNTLEGRPENKGDDLVTYGLAVTNYKANHKDDVYFCAYSIYKDPDGNIVVTVKDYGVEGQNAHNLYQFTLDMYINGAINSSNTDDAAVWNTLLAGAVTLTESDYTAGESGTKKADGTYYTGDFLFAEIPVILQKEISEKIKLTLVEDTNNGSWVAIYRGEGEIVQTYSYGRLGQLISHLATGTVSPSPKLTPDSEKKINTVIYDHGITKIGAYALYHQDGVNTVVYPEGATFGDSAFYQVVNLNTVYKAKAEGKQDNKVNLIDLSGSTITNTAHMLRNVAFGSYSTTVKLKMPSTITAIGANFAYYDNTYSRYLIKLWTDATSEPEDGVIDLTGATSLTTIGDAAFGANFSQISILMLPDSCTNISASAFTGKSATYYPAQIRTATKISEIAAYCETNGIEYLNLSGEPHGDSLSLGDVEVTPDKVY